MVSIFSKPRLSTLLKSVILLILFGIFSNYLMKNSSQNLSNASKYSFSLVGDAIDNFEIESNDQVFTTDCECKKDTQVVLRKINKNKYSVNLVKRNSLLTHYMLNYQELNESQFTCSHYNIFKRGKNQKIIGYSLYGTGY